MSLKELFNKKSNKILQENSLDDVGSELESEKYEESLYEDKKRFIPDVDYSDLSNYVKFGSAEKYYYDSITSIYKTYPYDGSLYEKLNWTNKNSDLTNYIFDNLYPRTNGYINLGLNYGTTITSSFGYSLNNNLEYILLKGGPNKSDESSLKAKFSKANVLDLEKNRSYNLYINGTTGLTTEFWLKKDNFSGSAKQVIFDLWNSGSLTSNSYGRFKIEIHPGISGEENKFYLTVLSGTSGIENLEIGTNLQISNGSWNHYAFSLINTGSNLKIELYKNGELNNSIITGSSISEVTGAYLATIGSLITQHSASSGTSIGYGKLSGSLDEFRFWKSKRLDKYLKRYWFTQIGGGTNTDDANTDLGVYYKFNEGIYNTNSISSYDKKVLDYSGRLSNGNWIGYSVGSRNTNSAMVQSGYTDSEFKDPIIYSGHPQVSSLLEQKIQEGKEYDINNNSSIINTFPSWMLEEDAEQLKNLSQLISEYFDEMYLKIKFLPEIHDTTYRSGKPITFANKLLESHGFNTSDIFIESDILETLAGRSEKTVFQDKLDNVKNFIYQNIYNNLTFLYRSKGTEKSIRNFFRCFGIDENLIKVNLYANNVVYTLEDRYINTSIKKKYVDFNNSTNFESTVYQYSTSSIDNSLSYIPGNINHKYNGATLQVEINLPFKFEENTVQYIGTPFVTSSIIGMHSADTSNPSDYTWYGSDVAGLQIYVIKDNTNSKKSYFKLTSSYLGIDLTSSFNADSYDSQKWNLNVAFYHEKYPYAGQISGSDEGNYIVEFSGYNVISDVLLNQFNSIAVVTSSLAENYFASAKRIYVGAHRQNFTGSLLESSDVRATSVRYWLSKLSEKTLLEHAKDPGNYGSENPIDNLLKISSINSFIPANKTLCLHWDFENVSNSDNGTGIGPDTTLDANFTVLDLTSGSQDSKYADIGSVTKYNYIGKGDFFPRNSNNVVKREFVSALKRKLPESLNDSDMINILTMDDITFTKDTSPVNHYFIIEKSMYQVISDEMVKFFGTITSLNSIIGEPIQRYNLEYNNLNKLKEMFFEEVQNDMDLEKYMSFYKWFDQSIGQMVEQLVPMSAEFINGVKTVIESHILERNKYQTKLPTLEIKKEPKIPSVKSINELKYNWRFGHAPEPPYVSSDQTVKCLWWNQRAERVGNLNLADRQDIFKVVSNTFNRKINSLYDIETSVEANNTITKEPEQTLRKKAIDYLLPIIKFSGGTYISVSEYEEVICNDEDE